MNNFWNFEIPYFNEQMGSDWSPFKTVVDDNVDYMMNKTWDLYKLKDISMMPIRATEIAISLRGIEVDPGESVVVKKAKLRSFNKDFKAKGMQDTYLDYQEIIVGTRGNIYNGYILGTAVWGISAWNTSGTSEATDRIWSTTDTKFIIYIDAKTTDSSLLDELVMTLRGKSLLPAFYQIYITDSDFNILRTV